jgi:adenine-specific DNA-methyltransferase
MKTGTEKPLPLLHTLDRDELVRMVEELQEEKRMREAFSHISETGSNDAALMWQGRNRFLAENVAPVSIQRVDEKSYPSNVGGEHRIIDGDNLAVMRSLLTEYRGGPKTGFDVIYFDPPYNTGSDTFAYNDNYRFSKSEVERLKNIIGRVEKGVSLDDPSRHTKWINHIAPRLWAARKLLKHTGVLIVSIDEHELPRLWMLLEEMYGEKNRIATLVWERSRKNDAKYVSEGHEYILLWARDKNILDEKMKRLANTKEWGNSKGRWRR